MRIPNSQRRSLLRQTREQTFHKPLTPTLINVNSSTLGIHSRLAANTPASFMKPREPRAPSVNRTPTPQTLDLTWIARLSTQTLTFTEMICWQRRKSFLCGVTELQGKRLEEWTMTGLYGPPQTSPPRICAQTVLSNWTLRSAAAPFCRIQPMVQCSHNLQSTMILTASSSVGVHLQMSRGVRVVTSVSPAAEGWPQVQPRTASDAGKVWRGRGAPRAPDCFSRVNVSSFMCISETRAKLKYVYLF